MQRVEFFVLEGCNERERSKRACQEIETAFQAEERVLVWFDTEADLSAFDELLWTFADRSFVPHEPLHADSTWDDTPVLLSARNSPPAAPTVIVNLSAAVPPGAEAAQRIVEIIDADPARRQAARVRFKQYRDLGVEPVTHKLLTP